MKKEWLFFCDLFIALLCRVSLFVTNSLFPFFNNTNNKASTISLAPGFVNFPCTKGFFGINGELCPLRRIVFEKKQPANMIPVFAYARIFNN